MKFSLSETILDNKEFIAACSAMLFGTGFGLLGCVVLNKVLNKHVLTTCNRNLNEIVVLKTIVGDSYGCVSRKVLQGPAEALKP